MKFLKGFATFILLFISTLLILSFIALFSTKRLLSKENITDIIKQVDIKQIVSDDSLESINDTLEEVGLSKEYTQKLLENQELKETVGNFLSDIMSSVLFEGKLPNIDQKELTKALKNGVDVIVKEAKENNIDITDKDLEEIYNVIDEEVPSLINSLDEISDEVNKMLNEDEEYQQANQILGIVREIYKLMYLFLLGTIICIALCALMRRKNYEYVKFLRNVFIGYGVMFIINYFIIKGIYSLISDQIKEGKFIFDTCVGSVSNVSLVVGIISLIIGIILLIVKIIINKKLLSNQNLETA